MKHYNYLTDLKTHWDKAVALYEAGQRGSDSYFSENETQWMLENGLTPQEIYDFAEDFVSGGEPDFATFAVISDIRRHHFLDKLHGQLNAEKIDPATLPPKDADIDGITWLPRILAKAKAKLNGQLDPDTMYSCGGDRRFLKTHDIHPGEFLRKVAENIDNDAAVVTWVKSRSAQF